MEFFAVLAVIVALCIVFGVSADIMIAAALGLIALIIFTMTFLFIFFVWRLLRSRRTEAAFTKTEKPEGSRFRCAFYSCGGKEYPCVFPSEPRFMYKEGKTCRVFLHKSSGTVFDRYAATTCILGLIISLAFSAGAVFLAVFFFS